VRREMRESGFAPHVSEPFRAGEESG
jgi:hypothetical protein